MRSLPGTVVREYSFGATQRTSSNMRGEQVSLLRLGDTSFSLVTQDLVFTDRILLRPRFHFYEMGYSGIPKRARRVATKGCR
jgi:hypothetical protein